LNSFSCYEEKAKQRRGLLCIYLLEIGCFPRQVVAGAASDRSHFACGAGTETGRAIPQEKAARPYGYADRAIPI
jgi:hypothetical protein